MLRVLLGRAEKKTQILLEISTCALCKEAYLIENSNKKVQITFEHAMYVLRATN